MSSQNSANLASTHHDTLMSNYENRNLAKFVPSFWDDIFLSHPSGMDIDGRSAIEHEELKQEVRRMLVTSTNKPSQILHLIDAVQRLGVAYHFEKEIEDVIGNTYELDGCNGNESDDLFTAAVRFRLLREHGFNVHCKSFEKFKDEKGEFKESLISDVRGLLELYEAAHFGFHGEDTLEEAIAFTTSHLKSTQTTVLYPLSTQIANTLMRPLRKSLPRLVAWSYISIYEAYGSLDETLMKFAKLDFNILQNLHKKEIHVICRWWKDIDIKTNFPFIRDRFAESYFWVLGVYFEPRYTIARTFMAKFEQKRGHIPSAIECYVKQYGASEEEACKEFNKQINDAWKDINEGLLKPRAVAEQALYRTLNLTRVIDLMYEEELDAFTFAGKAAKTSITSLLIHPIPI